MLTLRRQHPSRETALTVGSGAATARWERVGLCSRPAAITAGTPGTMGGVAKRAGRIPSMAGALLEQAVEALRDAASSDALYRPVPGRYRGSLLEPLQARLDALNRRLRLLRNCVIFSALAAEAYINECLAAWLSPADVAGIDRLATLDKLILGPRLAGHDGPVRRGEEPAQTLQRLFQARNRLVHPKPGELSAYVERDLERDDAVYGPRSAMSYLVAVAHTVTLLQPLRSDRTFDWPAGGIWDHRVVLERHIDLTGPELADLPTADDPPIEDLLEQIRQRAEKLGRQGQLPEADG